MSKFSSQAVKPRSVIKAVTPARTFEGGRGFTRDAKSDLFLLAVTNMVSEKTFYESGKTRDDRFVSLIHAVTQEDPAWVARFVPFLRDKMNMRSASIVMAAEYVAAGGPNGRGVVASAISRADEPAEMLAYWILNYGKNIPKPIKRGVADAVNSVYNQYSALKYDGVNNVWRMGDVIELVHPKVTGWKNDLYKYLLDVRHNPENVKTPESLKIIENNRKLSSIPAKSRKAMLKTDSELLTNAGMTWESLSGWLQGPMDAKAWEAIIPSMGYMALIRNLRNFDQVGISDDSVEYVINKITDPEEVAKSRQFPYRFYSAYKNAPSENWKRALDKALNLSCLNIPELKGRTLVLVDVSGSMTNTVSGKSTIKLWEIGAVFAGALYAKNREVDVVVFGTNSKEVDTPKRASAMRVIQEIAKEVDKNQGYYDTYIGHGTNGNAAMRKHFKGHNRVVYFTDGQYYDCGENPGTMVYTFNLAGYGVTPFKQGSDGSYELCGFSDSVFSMMQMIEKKQEGKWPF